MSDAAEVARAYEVQARFCEALRAPFYAELMDRASRDAAAGGPALAVADGFSGDPLRGFLPLRVFAAVHRRVLAGSAPSLACYYPSTGGEPDTEAAWPALRAVLESERDAIASELGSFPQTNEVARSGVLLLGFLAVAHETGHPLHLLELGASSGLNLLWDRYRHELGGRVLGAPDSPVRIALEWNGPKAALRGDPRVASRAGCDLAPGDVRDAAAQAWTESFVWCEHVERLERLRAAVTLAREDPPRIDRARAGAWIASQLGASRPPGATVVYHSSFWAYVPEPEQAAIRSSLEAAGAEADRDRPLAWLRFEDRDDGWPGLQLRTWPGGRDRFLARSQPHPRSLRWVGE